MPKTTPRKTPKTLARAATPNAGRKPRKAARPGPAGPATTRGEETRARLLEAAYAEFRRNGYHGTSMRQIAQAAGVAVGGIYNHFHGKEQIFAAVLDARHPYRLILPLLADTSGATLEVFLRNAGERIRDAIHGLERELLPILFIELVEFQGRHLSEMVERVFPTLMSFAQTFETRRGQVRDLPLPVLMRSLVGLTIGHLLMEMILSQSPLFQRMPFDWYGSALDIYLHGVLKRGPAAPAAA